MYVKGADGKIVSRYQFVTEEEYEEMKKDSKLAKKILGLADDEELDDWVSSKQKYVMDAKGELVKGMSTEETVSLSISLPLIIECFLLSCRSVPKHRVLK